MSERMYDLLRGESWIVLVAFISLITISLIISVNFAPQKKYHASITEQQVKEVCGLRGVKSFSIKTDGETFDTTIDLVCGDK